MAYDISSNPIPAVRHIVPEWRLPVASVGLAYGNLIAAFGKAAAMLYVQPFGVDRASAPRRDRIGEDGRDPSW